MHLFVALTFLAAFCSGRHISHDGRSFTFRVLVGTGGFIYIATYISNMMLFTDPLMNIYNALLIWRPMLAGISCLLFAWGFWIFSQNNRVVIKTFTLLFFTMVIMLTYAHFWNIKLTPLERSKERPSSKTVENFTTTLNSMLEDGKVSFLYRGNYSPQITMYYYSKTIGKEAPIYRGKNYNYMWSQWDYSDENRIRVKEEFRDQILNSKFIIIPEYWSFYTDQQPYAYYKFREELVAILKEYKAPKFKVRAWVEDSPGVRLLVLQRTSLEDNGQDLFVEWPSIPEGSLRKFSNAVITYPIQ